MKILIISNTFWSIYNFRSSFIKKFIESKNEVLVASLKDKNVNKLKKIGSKIHFIDIFSKNTNPWKEIILLFQLKNLFNEYKPDVVINFTIKPIIYSSLLLKTKKVKVINTLDGFGLSLTKNFFFKKMIFFLFRISQSKIFKFYAVTNNDYELLKKKNLIPRKKLSLINGTGINLKHYNYSKPNNKKNTVFIFIGRFLLLKGIKLFVEASGIVKKKFRNTSFIAIGDFKEDNYSISKKELDLWKKNKVVKFIKPKDDIRNLINKSDCMVLPTTYPEGINRSLLESLSMGRPAITNKVGGCKQIIKNNFNGYIKLIKNENDLANMMIKFHNLNYKKKLRFSINGREFVEKNFNEVNIINKYLKDFR